MKQEKVHQILNQINARIRSRAWANVSQQERDAANVDAFYGAVTNGGIDAVFFNATYLGDMADELLGSLERIGAVRAAAIFKQGFAFFPHGRVPRTLDTRIAHLRQAKDKDLFDKLSQLFFQEAEREEEILSAFFAKHPNVFATHER